LLLLLLLDAGKITSGEYIVFNRITIHVVSYENLLFLQLGQFPSRNGSSSSKKNMFSVAE